MGTKNPPEWLRLRGVSRGRSEGERAGFISCSSACDQWTCLCTVDIASSLVPAAARNKTLSMLKGRETIALNKGRWVSLR